MPLVVGISDELQHVMQAVRFFNTVDTPNSMSERVGFRAAQEVVSCELWRVALALKQRTDFMAELVRMTDEQPTSIAAAMQQLEAKEEGGEQ